MVPISRKQVVRYAITGAITFCIVFVVFMWAIRYGYSERASLIVALIPAWSVRFVLHKWWTFEEKELAKAPIEAVPYVAVALGTFTLAIGLSEVIQLASVRVLVADLVAGTIVICARFLLFRRIFCR